MNKNFQFLYACFFSLLILGSCGKKDDSKPAPSITIDSVSSSSSKTLGFYGVAQSFNIYYTVNSSENLSRISFSESPTQDITKTVKPSGKTVPDYTAFSTPTKYNGVYTTSIPNNASSLDVTITAVDSKKKSTN